MVCNSWELCVFSMGLPIPVFKESVTVHESSMKEKCKQLYFFCLLLLWFHGCYMEKEVLDATSSPQNIFLSISSFLLTIRKKDLSFRTIPVSTMTP